jgi:glycosyltransferase involved in cell wall biosynthesis
MYEKLTKPKILFLLHLPPPVHGSSIVGQMIMNSTLINNSFSCTYLNLLFSKEVHNSGKVSVRKAIKFIGLFTNLIRNILVLKPNVCYFALSTTGFSFFKDSLLAIILKLFKIQIVYHLHNKGVINYQNNFIFNILYKIVFKKTDVIILSHLLYKDIEKYVTPTRVHVCPNGIQQNLINIKLKKNENVESTTILFLSNLIESKGVITLLEACSILAYKKIQFKCILVGSEGDLSQNDIEQKIQQLNILQHVKYIGKKYGEEKTQIYLESDIFVLPTFYKNECFPLVILEAMSMKLPVISTFEGGIPDIIDDGKTGFLIVQKNPEKLAEKLELLIKNSELRKEMGENAREKFDNNYQVKHFEQRLTQILSGILQEIQN